MFSNSFPILRKDRHGLQRKAEHAKHRRHHSINRFKDFDTQQSPFSNVLFLRTKVGYTLWRCGVDPSGTSLWVPMECWGCRSDALTDYGGDWNCSLLMAWLACRSWPRPFVRTKQCVSLLCSAFMC